MKENFNTPILFVIFNRPDTTKEVFLKIQKVKPEKLFIAADGPRNNRPQDLERIQETRKLVLDNIDWPCQVKTLLQDINLGCKRAVSEALNWFFKNVEEGIILEDDCLPDESFFLFCQEMLSYYRDNPKVMHITGGNFQLGKSRTKASYYFSKYIHIWGWASWQRAWKFYDVEIKNWPEYKKANKLAQICSDKKEINYWIEKFDFTYQGKIDTWDYQWLFTCWFNQGVSIVPNVNLISNIGFNNMEGTHCNGKSILSALKTKNILTIKHPQKIEVNQEADKYVFKKHLYIANNKLKKIIDKALLWLKKFF